MRPKVAVLVDGRIYYYDCLPIDKRTHNPISGKFIDFAKTEIYKLKGDITIRDLTGDDIFYEMRQKGIDMKIGIDIATLALKKQVNQIVLISGDEDFVPASKLARREGIDFVLDPLWNPIDHNLFEHIDGLHSTSPKPIKLTKRTAETPSKTL